MLSSKWGDAIIDVLGESNRPLYVYKIFEKIKGGPSPKSITKAIEGSEGLGMLGLLKIFKSEKLRTGDYSLYYILSVKGILYYISIHKIEKIDKLIETYKAFYPHPLFMYWEYYDIDDMSALYHCLKGSAKRVFKYYSSESLLKRLIWYGFRINYKYVNDDSIIDEDIDEESNDIELYDRFDRAVLNYFSYEFFKCAKNNLKDITDKQIKSFIDDIIAWKYNELLGPINEVKKLADIYGVELE